MTSSVTTAEPATQPPPSGAPKASRSKRFLTSGPVEASLTFMAFLALFAIYSIWLGNTFLNVDARLLDVHQNVPILLLGLAALVTLVCGQFDLSIASMGTLSTFLCIGLTTKQGWPFGLILVACLGVGVLGGLLNGLLVEKLSVNAFIATLGTSGVFLGISKVYSEGAQIVPTSETNQLPQWFSDLGTFTQRFPWPILAAAAILAAVGAIMATKRFRPPGWTEQKWTAVRVGALAVIALILVFLLRFPEWIEKASWLIGMLLFVSTVMWVLMQYTTFGRYLKATGANREAARLAGVRTQQQIIRAFMIGGVLAALAGVVLASSQGAASPDVAGAFLLPAFAAAFLSTVVFSTGQFTIWGTIIGGIFIVWVSQGLILGGLNPQYTDVVNGTVLVLAVALSTVMRRSST